MQKTTTFIMFTGDQFGKAEEAINFYTSIFNNSGVKNIKYYKEDEPGGKAGNVKLAVFTLEGTEYMVSENSYEHQFGFTPSISIFVHCENEDELVHLFGKLSEDGKVLMALDNYGFSKKFGWTNDKYGVSWQLNLME